MVKTRNGNDIYDELCRICELVLENRQKAESFDRLMQHLEYAKKGLVTGYDAETDEWWAKIVEREEPLIGRGQAIIYHTSGRWEDEE